MNQFLPIILLIISNVFMTYAWYGHLKDFSARALWVVVFISWGVAFFEYCFQVPANRLGAQYYSVFQLKMIQEIIGISVFAGFAVFYMGVKPTLNFLWAGLCILGAVYFVFRDQNGF